MNLQSIKRIFRKRRVAELNASERKNILSSYSLQPAKIQIIQQKPRWVVYDVDEKAILKITHSSERSYETLNAITHWQAAMHRNVKEVIPVIPSKDGQLSVKVSHDNGYFTSVLYKRVKGELFKKRNWSPDVVFKVGTLTGKMHEASKKVGTSEFLKHIPVWHEMVIEEVLDFLPAHEHELKARFNNLLSDIRQIPVTRATYGIIHSDIFLGNLIIDNSELSIYDFDDTCISWFALEIGTVIYSSLMDDRKNMINNKDYIPHFMNCFWKGYNSHSAIDEQMKRLLPSFLALRAIYIYAHYCKQGYEKATFPATIDFFKHTKYLAHNQWEAMDYKLFV